MKRAANQSPGEAIYKTASNAAVAERPRKEMQNSEEVTEERILGSKADISKSQDKSQEKTKMTRFTNGVAPAVTNGHKQAHTPGHTPAHQAVQQLQIVRLLQDLGERLRNSEKEREILWKELDGCRKLLTDIEDKTSKTEKAYLTLEHKVSQGGSADIGARQEEMEKLNRALLEKIEAVETVAGSAIVRVEDAISENSKLSRRLDQVSQDKTRLLRKLETMEEALTQTQDALKAKALVLLTDQALASRTSLPQTPAWSGNDTLRMTPPQAQAGKAAAATVDPLIDEGSLFRRRTSINTTLLVSFAVLGIAGGWALSKLQVPDINMAGLFRSSDNAKTVAITQSKTEASQEEVMSQIAQLANQVEPGADVAPVASAEDFTKADEETAQVAEKAAAAAFRSDRPSGPPADRIEPDSSLPKIAQDIEARAFDGDAEAQHDLAAIYTAGHAGVKTNYDRAAAWFAEAAYNNVANAQYNLGVLYHQGLGVKADTQKAIQLYRVAASNGHPEAEYNLGIAHIEGVGADYSPRLATRYFEKAAAGGIVEAAYNLGLIEENGLVGQANPDEAVFWYKTAADEGNGQAKQALLQLQKERKLTDQDIARIHNRIAVLKPNAFQPKEISEQIRPKVVKPEAIAAAIEQVAPAQAKKAPAAKPAAASQYDAVIVAQIQEKLNQLGLYDGAADGTVGPATEDAVKAYQSQNKLKVDGKPTEDVLVHMLATEMQVNAPAAGSDN